MINENIKGVNEKETGDKNIIAQAKTFGRQPKEAIESWQERGYNILNFDTTKYQKDQSYSN